MLGGGRATGVTDGEARPRRGMARAESDEALRTVLREVRTIAVVGASARPQRASHGVMRFLQRHGYRCIPVNPSLAGQQLLGERVYADLRAIPDRVDMVDIFRNPAHVGPIVDAAIAIGAAVVWMQLGVINEAAAARAEAAGLTVVMNHCPAIEYPRLMAQ